MLSKTKFVKNTPEVQTIVINSQLIDFFFYLFVQNKYVSSQEKNVDLARLKIVGSQAQNGSSTPRPMSVNHFRSRDVEVRRTSLIPKPNVSPYVLPSHIASG